VRQEAAMVHKNAMSAALKEEAVSRNRRRQAVKNSQVLQDLHESESESVDSFTESAKSSTKSTVGEDARMPPK
jgi:hypothetical protein